MEKDRLFETSLVGYSFNRDISSLHNRASIMGAIMIQYFMRFKPGWWILHLVAIGFTLYLGHIVSFFKG